MDCQDCVCWGNTPETSFLLFFKTMKKWRQTGLIKEKDLETTKHKLRCFQMQISPRWETVGVKEPCLVHVYI